nr:Trafficking protein particle complex subunit 2-like protein [Polyrhizophydium stewartii]
MASPAKVVALAVIGKNNNPLYVRNFSTQPDLKFHFIAHTSCDVIEERVAPGTRSFDLYLGLLYVMEDLAVFGYMTNTRIKFVLMVSATDAAIKDQEIKAIFRKIHAVYVDLQLDPFWDPEAAQMISNQNALGALDGMLFMPRDARLPRLLALLEPNQRARVLEVSALVRRISVVVRRERERALEAQAIERSLRTLWLLSVEQPGSMRRPISSLAPTIPVLCECTLPQTGPLARQGGRLLTPTPASLLLGLRRLHRVHVRVLSRLIALLLEHGRFLGEAAKSHLASSTRGSVVA